MFPILARRARQLAPLYLGFAASVAGAASLPGSLSREEMGRITRQLAIPSIHRPYGGHGLPSDGEMGLDLGVDTTFVFRRDVLNYGDGRGVAPNIIPVPRLWASVDLTPRFKLSGSYSPGRLVDGITVAGTALQWIFFVDEERDLRVSSVLGYSWVDVFDDMSAHVTDVTFQVSKDLLMWQPYFGLGFSVGNSTFDSAVVGSGVERGPHTEAVSHVVMGVRLELAAKLSFQLDVFGSRPAASLLLETSF